MIAAICVVVLLIVIKSVGSNKDIDKSIETKNTEETGVAETSEPTADTPAASDAKTKNIEEATVGDYITFGTYEQDNDTSNGQEDIEWLVLDKEDDRLLVISRYVIDCQKYNDHYEPVTWETCSLRTWLNDVFLNNAFSSDEQIQILTTTVTAEQNKEYYTLAGNDTEDKVFLLSVLEAERYFNSDKARQCTPTEYAIALYGNNLFYTVGNEAVMYWWLRTPGDINEATAIVGVNGSVYDDGIDVDFNEYGVRPALWISL